MTTTNTTETTTTESNTKASPEQIAQIDAAIARAKARKLAKEAATAAGAQAEATAGKAEKGSPEEVAAKEAERSAKKSTQERERAAAKARRDAERAAKKAAREATKANSTPHMAKVEKARAKLPTLSDDAQALFNTVTASLSAPELTALAAHIEFQLRVNATQQASTSAPGLKEGDLVRIVSGDARYLNQVGLVTKAARIRCFVELEGVSKPVYLFVSDVELVQEDAASTEVEESTDEDMTEAAAA